MIEVILTPEEQINLEEISTEHPHSTWQRVARIILLYASGKQTSEVASETGISRSRARSWRRRFLSERLGLFRSHDWVEVVPQIDRLEDGSTVTPIKSQDTANIQVKPPKEVVSDEFIPQDMQVLRKIKQPGVRPEDVLPDAARKILRYHFIQMLLHEEGTRLGEDIEELHDMRVATRRMRAAFDVFEDAFETKVSKPHIRGLRATGRALGAVRDMDVFIEKAQGFVSAHTEDGKINLQPLIDAWDAERQQNRIAMLMYLNGEKYPQFKQKFWVFVNLSSLDEQPDAERGLSSGKVREIAPVLIYQRFSTVRCFDLLVDNASLEQLHALRINCKRLRYTLEFFREVLGKEIEMVIDELKAVQDHLGDLNDAHVATQILRDFLARWDTQQDLLPVDQRQSPDPIIAYLSARYAERQRLMGGFRDAWDRFNRPEVRQNLAQAIAVL